MTSALLLAAAVLSFVLAIACSFAGAGLLTDPPAIWFLEFIAFVDLFLTLVVLGLWSDLAGSSGFRTGQFCSTTEDCSAVGLTITGSFLAGIRFVVLFFVAFRLSSSKNNNSSRPAFAFADSQPRRFGPKGVESPQKHRLSVLTLDHVDEDASSLRSRSLRDSLPYQTSSSHPSSLEFAEGCDVIASVETRPVIEQPTNSSVDLTTTSTSTSHEMGLSREQLLQVRENHKNLESSLCVVIQPVDTSASSETFVQLNLETEMGPAIVMTTRPRTPVRPVSGSGRSSRASSLSRSRTPEVEHAYDETVQQGLSLKDLNFVVLNLPVSPSDGGSINDSYGGPFMMSM
eukprot:CAMPEP_0184658132 /NCGR_PEP_ID=MMETSP0308-20130426/23669_1 /TAXON_ID=38269 /ORGANISM="Gloeochaete witrockiana, Strain SAG 46.84" /LENGTH=343 /DNA_ID=CAMNT_0027096789 /DNA_START=242 /DNA_END=1273 /DNA_ORIENTATION=-